MDNWIIENDNLIAMQDLLLEYEGKIDVMPIDPPYNTEISGIGYKDSQFDDGWEQFIRPRLEVAYKLLSDKGVMFIHIDENELCSLMGVCSSIFGQENISTMVWKKTNALFDVNRVEKPYINNVRRTHEFVIVCYKDRANTKLNNILQPVWDGSSMHDVSMPMETVLDGFGTTSSAKDEIGRLLGDRATFSTPKPMRLIKEMVRVASKRNSIILDFFAGSGTTGHAVMDLNMEDGGQRKFILITNNESDIFKKVTVPRIQKAIATFNYEETFKIKPLPDYRGIIGMEVDVTMDRPIGTEHPRHPNVFYPINYGFVAGMLGGDDEEQDVYILGKTKPLDFWSGVIVGVIHRTDDVEDKWIAAPKGSAYTLDEMEAAVAFQEQFHQAIYYY